MVEVALDSSYGLSSALVEKEEVGVKIKQLGQEALSPIDYRTQALLTFFFGSLGISDFYAGNSLRGCAKLAAAVILTSLVRVLLPIVPVFHLLSLIQLSQGKYKDAEGKVIRQVVQLKKEEMSSCDQTTALVLSFCLGLFGAHQFYAGKPLKGVLMLCSLGGLGIWNTINIYQLTVCGFKDGKGKTICPDYIKQTAM